MSDWKKELYFKTDGVIIDERKESFVSELKELIKEYSDYEWIVRKYNFEDDFLVLYLDYSEGEKDE